MLETVLKDQKKIEGTIDELDRYKRDALQKTWDKVNKYVFNHLAPNIWLINSVTGTLVVSLLSSYLATLPNLNLLKGRT